MMNKKWMALLAGATLIGAIGCGDDDPPSSTNNNNGTNNPTNNGTNNPTNNGTNNPTNNETNNEDPMARLQVIHNSPDPAAAEVDVYVNGELFLDDFPFRTATPFVDVPAEVELSIAVAASDSTSVDDALETFTYTLDDGSATVLVASGVLDPSAFPQIPVDQGAFGLYPIANAEEAAEGDGARVAVFHGGVDAPAVDVVLNNDPTLRPVVNASFGDATGYVDFPAGEVVVLDVIVNASGARAASFQALVPQVAAVVVASGFLAPDGEQAGFGLFAFLSTGGPAIPLPVAARAQIIHNAADPGASTVDVYFNDNLALDDFAFRTATPFITVPSGGDIVVGVAESNSAEAADAIHTQTVQFEPGSTNIVVANGVLTPADFAANPDGESTEFGLWLKNDARETAEDATRLEFTAVHGATDAPAVDIRAALTPLVSDVKYGDISAYVDVIPATYTINITPAGDEATVVHTGALEAMLRAGEAVTVLASGFLDPAANQNGPAFEVVVFTALGGAAIVLD